MAQLDQLLQKYEFENSHLSKAISTETDKQNIVNKQRRDIDKQTNEFEEKITSLREEIGKTKVYEIEKNRGIDRLKDEAYILRDHRNTIRARLDKQKENNKQIINNTEEMIREGTKKLEKYLEKYETIPAAKKILEETERRDDLKNKIEKLKEHILALKEKEKDNKLFVDKRHFQVFKLKRSICASLIECSQFRKNAKLKYSEILENHKLREKINKPTTNQEIQPLIDVNKNIRNKQMFSEQLQSAKKIHFLRENFPQKERTINEQNNQQEMDTNPTPTSTPKITPIHIPNIHLSPLISLTPSIRCDTNVAQIPSTPKAPRLTIPQIKTPNLLQTTSTLNNIVNTQRFKPPTLTMPHSNTNSDTICEANSPPDPTLYNTSISMDTHNQGQVEVSEFRFGFMDEVQKSSNPFGPMEFETINRTESGFVTNLFSNCGNGNNQFQEADNPFSFVP